MDTGASCLWISAQNGHLQVVKALLEAGGRELLMLTADDRSICLSVARRANQGEVCRVLTYVFRLKAMAVQRARREREQ